MVEFVELPPMPKVVALPPIEEASVSALPPPTLVPLFVPPSAGPSVVPATMAVLLTRGEVPPVPPALLLAATKPPDVSTPLVVVDGLLPVAPPLVLTAGVGGSASGEPQAMAIPSNAIHLGPEVIDILIAVCKCRVVALPVGRSRKKPALQRSH
jgi:hypothetical protein